MRQVLHEEGKVVLYRRQSDEAESQIQCRGYELAIMEGPRISRSWLYESREQRWAHQGLKALLDAQARNVLGQPTKWRPYNGIPCHLEAPTIHA
jgi:hypothetical protein